MTKFKALIVNKGLTTSKILVKITNPQTNDCKYNPWLYLDFECRQTSAFSTVKTFAVYLFRNCLYSLGQSYPYSRMTGSGYLGHRAFFQIWNLKRFKKIIVVSFEHLQKLFWFWKFGGCGIKSRSTTHHFLIFLTKNP